MKAYQPKEVVNSKADMRSQIIQQLPDGFKPYSKGLIASYTFVFPPPATMLNTKAKREKYIEDGFMFKTTKPDIDNLIKNLNDAMESIVYVNDSQICVYGEVQKIFGDTPRIEVTIKEID
jgi:Holliday junction resolvase RusA-like endonuclease